MKLLLKVVVAGAVAVATMQADAPNADAGLFAKLFKGKCCQVEPEAEPVCCEPAPEPEPVCCCVEPEPVCCEPAPEPEPACCEPVPCCEPAPEPEPCCSSAYSMPPLAAGEVLVWISPLVSPTQVAVKAQVPAPQPVVGKTQFTYTSAPSRR